MTPLDDDVARFRERVLDAIRGKRRFGYVSKDVLVGTCPVCGYALAVRFAGRAPRVQFTCLGELPCAEADVARKVGV